RPVAMKEIEGLGNLFEPAKTVQLSGLGIIPRVPEQSTGWLLFDEVFSVAVAGGINHARKKRVHQMLQTVAFPLSARPSGCRRLEVGPVLRRGYLRGALTRLNARWRRRVPHNYNRAGAAVLSGVVGTAETSDILAFIVAATHFETILETSSRRDLDD